MHISVLLNECIEYLNLKEDSVIVDATLGYAGHSSEILKRIKRGKLFAFDQDIEAIKVSDSKLSSIANNYEIINSNFVNMKYELEKRGINKVNGILFDLGVSSPQLDEDYRGFSFHNDATLDMRMDINNPLTAKRVVNEYSLEKLKEIFIKYGEEKYAYKIAQGIVNYRSKKEIETTLELVEIIKSNVPEKYKREKHPARKVFQAIRIEVNDELKVLESVLPDAIDMLSPGGRISVITFHSLEDRITKQVFKKFSEVPEIVKGLPSIPDEFKPKIKLINKKPILPSKEEMERNSRSKKID